MLIAFALLLFPARSAGREHRFSLGVFRCFSRRLLGQPSRLGFFPALSFASCRLGSLPGGQLFGFGGFVFSDPDCHSAVGCPFPRRLTPAACRPFQRLAVASCSAFDQRQSGVLLFREPRRPSPVPDFA